MPQKTILFAGVTFMGESAKILNPDKTVVMADECADCPMAHMITADRIAEVREEYEDLAAVSYTHLAAVGGWLPHCRGRTVRTDDGF